MFLSTVTEAVYSTGINNTNADSSNIKYLTIIFPLITAVITFFLTSLFTMYKDKKTINISRRVFIEYAEYLLDYPFNEETTSIHGNGLLLLGDNGKKLIRSADKDGEKHSYLVLKNITNNDVINVLIKTEFLSDGILTSEEFNMPIWKHKDSIYIPQTFNEGSSVYSQNELLKIRYTTSNFEEFEFGYIRQQDGTYQETLKKKYLGFIWLNKVKYYKSKFYSFHKVGKKEDK